MIIQNTVFGLVLRSLRLDKDFLFCHYPKRFVEKLEFIVKKYLLLIKHLILHIPPEPGRSRIHIGGREIYYESSFGISIFLAMIVNIETYVLRYLRHLRNPLVIDAGAHLGFFSLTIANLLDEPRIYACEPVSLTFTLLSKNCRGIKAITPIPLGFSNKTSKARIYYDQKLLMYSSLFSRRLDGWSKNLLSEVVQLQSLDAFLEEKKIDRIDILKIDVEGSEEKILQGARKALERTNYLLLECSLDQVAGSTFSSLMHHLYGPTYNFQLVSMGPVLYDQTGAIVTVDLFFKNILFKHRS
ncbi:MAG TPA: FkbM family methyltransferase [Patescibacteria group bacterium]|nr:FkbM family methyltransferase [Patescibacteria group bacterium]